MKRILNQNSVLYILLKNEIKFIQGLWILDCQESKILLRIVTLRTVGSLDRTLFICILTTFVTVSPLSVIKIFQVSCVIWFCSYTFLTIFCSRWLWHHFNSSSHNSLILLADLKNLSQKMRFFSIFVEQIIN